MREVSLNTFTNNGLFSINLLQELQPFNFDSHTRVVFGAGSLDRLGALASELGGEKILLVTDPGLRAAGHVDRALRALAGEGLKTATFDGVEENPTTRHVAEALELAKKHDINLLVGLGGGSSMDCAKGVNFLFSNGGRMSDYWGIGKAEKPMLPMIAVPTTAGTGSEAQSFALISNEKTHQKMACGDKKAACAVALLDPELTLTQPERVTAMTGIDAIAHAVESYVTTKRNQASQRLSREAWKLLQANFRTVLRSPQNLDARSAMLLGAHYAGAAIENSMLGATHALANPLMARYGTPHGAAIGLLLPHVVRFNSDSVADLYTDLAAMAGFENGETLADELESLIREAGLPDRLETCGVKQEDLASLAEEAAQQWTAKFNPRPVSPIDLRELYERAF